MNSESLSIVIPVYNSEGSLPLLLERLAALLPALATNYEVILINDGSRDGSGSVIDQACNDYEWVLGIHLMRNFGQHAASLCGIRQARFARIITMDDDLQNPPEELPRLLGKLAEGFDVVYGYPEHESHGLLRDFASRITKLTLQKTMGIDVAKRVSSFRAFRPAVLAPFENYHGAFVSIDVLLSWSTSRFAAIPVPNPERTIGKSTYTVRKLIIHAINMITGFSTLPLQLASICGFVFAIFGFCLLLYVLTRYLLNGEKVAGFPFLASVLSIFSGVQMFAIGIIGEYLARMHVRLMERPAYVTREMKGTRAAV